MTWQLVTTVSSSKQSLISYRVAETLEWVKSSDKILSIIKLIQNVRENPPVSIMFFHLINLLVLYIFNFSALVKFQLILISIINK